MYIFKKEPNDPEFDNSSIIYQFPNNGNTLAEMLEHFENFLKSCGFHFEGKFLDFFEEEENKDVVLDEIRIDIENTDISFTLKKDQFIKLADMANKSDMTLNQFINKKLSDYIDEIESEEEHA